MNYEDQITYSASSVLGSIVGVALFAIVLIAFSPPHSPGENLTQPMTRGSLISTQAPGTHRPTPTAPGPASFLPSRAAPLSPQGHLGVLLHARSGAPFLDTWPSNARRCSATQSNDGEYEIVQRTAGPGTACQRQANQCTLFRSL